MWPLYLLCWGAQREKRELKRKSRKKKQKINFRERGSMEVRESDGKKGRRRKRRRRRWRRMKMD